MKHTNFILILFLVILNSCSNDDSTNTVNPAIVIETEAQQNARISNAISSNTINTTIVITTRDQNGNLLPNVNFQINNTSYLSGANAILIIENLTVNEDYLLIIADKTGYEKAFKTITASKNGLTNVDIKLLDDVPSKTLDASTGGIVSLNNLILDFPANAIEDSSGNTYSGNVDINMIYYNPNATNFSEIQPGTLSGITIDNTILPLVSEGMFTVDLTDNSGNPLNVASGETVKVTMPASTSGPNTIPFLSLNETYGIWVEEGLATKVGNTYEFEVAHFSTYNLDWFDNPIDSFCVVLKDQNNNVLENQRVIVRLGNGNTKYAYSDNVGEICFVNASSGNYNFEIPFYCDLVNSGSMVITSSGTYDVSFDFSASANLINYTSSGLLYACNNQLANNKAFILEIDDNSTIVRINGFSNSQGQYNLSKNLCLNPSVYPANLYIFDDNTVLINSFNLDLNPVNLTIDLSACEPIVGLSPSSTLSISDIGLDLLVSYSSGGFSGPYLYSQILDITIISAAAYMADPINGTFDPSTGTILPPELSIISLDGLQFFTSLQTLELAYQNISDVSFLFGLTSLVNLDLRGNPISQTDINALIIALPSTTVLF